MITFPKTLGRSAFEGKDFHIGCGTIKLLAVKSTDLSRKYLERCLKDTGFASIQDFVSEQSRKGIGKQNYISQEILITETHNKIYDAVFVSECIVAFEPEEGVEATLDQIKAALLEPENRFQLEEIRTVSSMDVLYLAIAEEDAKADLKKSSTGISST